MKIPVYITNKDRVTPMRKLVEWLLITPDVGKVTILDNGSTYEPLLEWYDEIKQFVSVEMLGEQESLCWVFWAQKREEKETGPYIVTDGDYVPASFCPDDIVGKMVELLERHFHEGYWKVGPGLRIDNLPDCPWRDLVVTGQGPYHRERLGEGYFRSAIDTSFAVYKGGFGDSQIGHAIRLDAPYLFEHYPWYVWPLDDEQRYYMAHDRWHNGHTSWLVAQGIG